MLRAGARNCLVTVERLTRVNTSDGGYTETWLESQPQEWVSVETSGSGESIAANVERSSVTYRVGFARARSDVTPEKTRLAFTDPFGVERHLYVTGIDTVGFTGKGMTATCEERPRG